MLLDSTHKRWFWITLVLTFLTVAVWCLFNYLAPLPLTGGSTVGLWYGVVGAGLMIYAGLLAAHRRLPRWQWIGRRQTWLRGHIWLGMLSGVFLLCHSGFRWGGPLEQLLWVAVGGTLITGIIGLALQQSLPRTITQRVQSEAPYEQLPHLCRMMRRKADALVDAICADDDVGEDPQGTRGIVKAAENGPLKLRTFYEQEVRPFLAAEAPRRSPLYNPLQTEIRFDSIGRLAGLETSGKQLAELAGLCDERRQMADQERLHFWLHAWLLVHIPFSAGVLILGTVHVIATQYY